VNPYDHPSDITLVEQTANEDVFQRQFAEGSALILVPGIWDSMPPDLLALVRARRGASLTGHCPVCAAEPEPVNGALAMRHEDFCEVTDDHLGPRLAAWSRRVGQYARGKRIVEDPAS
jgi:hypothetical protein